MNEFQVPADLGRIPGKIYCGEGFSNFTADQWRIFISIYATVVLWEYLEEVDRKILTYFVRICHLFVNRILETKSLDEIHKKIVDVTLIEKKYGRNVITPNLHLSLHLSACSHDFGPLYAFWCFSFERMNGILEKNNEFYSGLLIGKLKFVKKDCKQPKTRAKKTITPRETTPTIPAATIIPTTATMPIILIKSEEYEVAEASSRKKQKTVARTIKNYYSNDDSTIDKRIYLDKSYLKSAAASCVKLEFHEYFKNWDNKHWSFYYAKYIKSPLLAKHQSLRESIANRISIIEQC
ncbi:hypothetical protein Glove_384g66 [Diversispora epigaea]|uniref:DUF4218 domain-containing protein n=1 Tax=Diversispora epigaea TaxID=1348612 RepID=A0A397H4T7_9GLOM|nr:hypothetical protein Glove_384g66 [Diversispora epigaea]